VCVCVGGGGCNGRVARTVSPLRSAGHDNGVCSVKVICAVEDFNCFDILYTCMIVFFHYDSCMTASARFVLTNIHTYIRLFTTQVDIKKDKIQTDRQTDRQTDTSMSRKKKIINLHKLL